MGSVPSSAPSPATAMEPGEGECHATPRASFEPGDEPLGSPPRPSAVDGYPPGMPSHGSELMGAPPWPGYRPIRGASTLWPLPAFVASEAEPVASPPTRPVSHPLVGGATLPGPAHRRAPQPQCALTYGGSSGKLQPEVIPGRGGARPVLYLQHPDRPKTAFSSLAHNREWAENPPGIRPESAQKRHGTHGKPARTARNLDTICVQYARNPGPAEMPCGS
jgi:hypothetical protein